MSRFQRIRRRIRAVIRRAISHRHGFQSEPMGEVSVVIGGEW